MTEHATARRYDDETYRCVFCNDIPIALRQIEDMDLYRFDCARCGRYETSRKQMERMRLFSPEDRAVMVHSIRLTNKRGLRFSLNTGLATISRRDSERGMAP